MTRKSNRRSLGLTPDTLRSCTASLLTAPVIAVSSIINLLGTAALASPGPLSPHIGAIIGTLLAGSIIACAYCSLRTGLTGTLMEMQEAPAMLSGLMGAAIYAGVPESWDDPMRAGTVIAAFALTTTVTGIFFLLLGWLRLGELIRYIPFPVVGGVLAGLGLLMMEGALSVVTGLDIQAGVLPALLEPDMLTRWAPALVFAGVIGWVTSRVRHFATIPALLALATGLFFASSFAAGQSLHDLASGGWLLGPFPPGSLFQDVDYSALLRVDPGLLLTIIPNIISVMLIATVGVLLHASGLELATREDIELNRELRVCGVGNVGAGLAGGIPIFHGIANTLLMRTMGAGNRATPLLVVALWIAILAYGGTLIGYFPRTVLAGLLFFLGGSLMWQWLVQGYTRLPLGDWLVIVLIVVIVALVGYMEALVIGTLAGVVLFQISYTKIDVVKHSLSGTSFHSNVVRSEAAQSALSEHGDRLFAIQLQGYIFFGTANNIVAHLKARLEETDRAPPGWLVVDFRQVGGLDWAAVTSFRKLEQIAAREGFVVLYAEVGTEILKSMIKGEIIDEERNNVFDTLDEAMEWCEEQLLDELAIHVTSESTETGLPEVVARAFPEADDQHGLLRYLTPRHYDAGETLIQQGEKASSLFLIQGGRASVHIENEQRKRIRVRSYESGAVLGEIGFYSGIPRAATVVADTNVTALIMTADNARTMQRRDPDLMRRFNEFVIDLLGKRLARTNHLVANLMH